MIDIDYNLLGKDYRYIDDWTYTLDVQQALLMRARGKAWEPIQQEPINCDSRPNRPIDHDNTSNIDYIARYNTIYGNKEQKT